MKTLFGLSLFFTPLLLLNSAMGQKLTINGYVKDAVSREVLIGASVIDAKSRTGSSTNQYGFFSLTVQAIDTVELIVSYQGYKIQVRRITARDRSSVEILLQSAADTLGEVVVSAARNDRNVQKAQMGVIDVPMSAVKNLPVLIAERDVMKIIQLMPGVQGGQEGTAGFYVRG